MKAITGNNFYCAFLNLKIAFIINENGDGPSSLCFSFLPAAG